MVAMEKIRLELTRRNGRIIDNFTDFDRLRSGTVTVEQFRRCLKMGALLDKLTEEEINDVISTYLVQNNGNFVNYLAFLRDVDADSAPQELLSPHRGAIHTLDDENEKSLARMYEFFRQRINATGLDVRALFKDFDKHHIFRVTPAQFERCFPFLIDAKIMKAIRQKYSDERGDIAYNCWCADVLQEPLTGTRREMKGINTGHRQGEGGFGSHNVDSLVREIRNQIATNRLRCEDFLRDYDKLRTGVVTEAQFSAALGRMRLLRFQLSASDLGALCSYYGSTDKSGTRNVNYEDFLRDVMPAPAVQQMNGTGSVPMSSTYGTRMNDDEEKRVEAVLAKVRSTIATQRMNLRPTFHDFDRAIKGTYRSQTCTRNRFERALAINKVNLAPAEVTLLMKRFATTGADGETGDINYAAFCDEVDARQPEVDVNKIAGSFLPKITNKGSYSNSGSPQKKTSATVAVTALQNATGYNTTAPVPGLTTTVAVDDLDMSLDGILTRLMNNIIARRVRLSEFIRDGDPLRSGAIPRDKFLSAIISSNVPLRKEEMEVLADNYAHPKIPHYIDINKFLDDVDTGVELMQNPAEQPIDWEKEIKQEVSTVRTHRKDESVNNVRPQLQAILRRVAEDVKARGVLLPPFFRDYDRQKIGKITKVQFHQTVSRHRFPVTDLEMELLKSYYENPKDAMCVRYRDFIGDVDDSENIALQLAQRQSVRKLNYTGTGTGSGAGMGAGSSYMKTVNKSFAGTGGSGSGTVAGNTVSVRTGEPISDDVARGAVQAVADFVLRRNVRLEEFFKDADPLKHSFVTCHRFRHALDILGITLSEQQMVALENAFASGKEPGVVAYHEFLGAVRDTKARAQIASMTADKTQVRTEVEEKLLDRIIEKVRRAFGSRRIASRQVFQDYDKLHKGRVPEGLFFTALLSVGLNLTPTECESLRKAYWVGDGSMYYGEFSARVDESLHLN